MTKNIAQQLEQAYSRASMVEVAKRVQTPQDWQRLKDIQTHSKQAKQHEQDNFRQEYPARVSDARVAILKERGERHYTHPAPLSAARRDRFDKDQIERQAHLRVHNAHHQTMANIDVQESREVKQLVQKDQSPAVAPQVHHIRRER